jgi:hypothetical protein
MKSQAVKDVAFKPLPGQKTLISEDDADGSGTQQVTIRVSAQAVRMFEDYSETHGLKRNRLFDEAIQVYAGLLAAGMRVTK